jgi:hypothetical protein
MAASPSVGSPPAFPQLGIVADNFEWPVTPRPEVEIQTKVDHAAALTSTNDTASISHRWIRVHLRSTRPGQELENVITIMRRANLRGMKVLVNVVQNVEDFDERSEFMVDLSGTSLECLRSKRVARFSQTSSEKFRARMVRMLKALSDHKLRVDAFEISNELDWGAFNGDLVNREGTAPTLSVMQQTVSKYAEIFKIAHSLIRNDATFTRAKLITFGFANPDRAYLTRPRSAGGLGIDRQKLPIIPAECFFGELQGLPYSFNGEVQQPLNKENILTKFADGIGLHVYAEDPGAVMQSFADIVRPSGKPLWITEWGYLKNEAHRKDDTRRAKINDFIRKANEMKAPPVETLFYYSYNDNWGIVAPMTPTSDPSVPGAVYDSAYKVFKDYVH